MLLPLLVIMGGLYIYPVVRTFILSFTNYSYLRATSKFVGFNNYKSFLFSPQGHIILKNTLFFVCVSVGIEMLLGLSFALLLNREFRAKRFVRGLILLPIMFVPVVVGYEWRWIFNDQFGILNYVLQKMGLLSHPLSWLSTPGLAMRAIILSEIWFMTPFVTIIILGALQAVPLEPYEAVKMDGASALQTFRYITLPFIKPGLLAALLLRMMDAFQVFDLIFILTYGGPGLSTEVVNTFTYKTAFRHFKLGYASSISIIALVIMVTIGLSLFNTVGRQPTT